jgi:predicted ATPase
MGSNPWDRPAFVPQAQVIPATSLGQLWDGVVLQSGEERVIQCLRILVPVDRITLIQNPAYAEQRIAIARVTGRAQPVPLRSLGDGVLRAFQLGLAIERSLKKGPTPEDALDEPMLLVDEFETGIHYSALPDVWRFVFHAARERGVQVFATTHSWDCIEAFQQAAAGEPEGSAMLVRLEQKDEQHRAVLFDQDELPTVTKHHIEVR